MISSAFGRGLGRATRGSGGRPTLLRKPSGEHDQNQLKSAAHSLLLTQATIPVASKLSDANLTTLGFNVWDFPKGHVRT